MKLIRGGIGYSNEGGNEENVLFQKLFPGGEERQEQKSREDAEFDEVQNLIFKHKPKRWGTNAGNGGDDKDQ